MNKKLEDIFRPISTAFVVTLDGRYRGHITDMLLVAFIMDCLDSQESHHTMDDYASNLVANTEKFRREESATNAVENLFRILDATCELPFDKTAEKFGEHVAGTLQFYSTPPTRPIKLSGVMPG